MFKGESYRLPRFHTGSQFSELLVETLLFFSPVSSCCLHPMIRTCQRCYKTALLQYFLQWKWEYDNQTTMGSQIKCCKSCTNQVMFRILFQESWIFHKYSPGSLLNPCNGYAGDSSPCGSVAVLQFKPPVWIVFLVRLKWANWFYCVDLLCCLGRGSVRRRVWSGWCLSCW